MDLKIDYSKPLTTQLTIGSELEAAAQILSCSLKIVNQNFDIAIQREWVVENTNAAFELIATSYQNIDAVRLREAKASGFYNINPAPHAAPQITGIHKIMTVGIGPSPVLEPSPLEELLRVDRTVGKTLNMPDDVKEGFIEEANKYIDLSNERTEMDDPVGYYQFSLRSIELMNDLIENKKKRTKRFKS